MNPILKHTLKYSLLFAVLVFLAPLYIGVMMGAIGMLFGMSKASLLSQTVDYIVLVFAIFIYILIFYKQAYHAPRKPFLTGLPLLIIGGFCFLHSPFGKLAGILIVATLYLVMTYLGATLAKKRNLLVATTELLEPNVKSYYFPISIFKLSIMYLSTLGWYSVYWWYRNWKSIKLRNNDQSLPLGRSIFPVFFYPAFLTDINHTNNLQQISGIRFPQFWVVFFWTILLSSLICHMFALLNHDVSIILINNYIFLILAMPLLLVPQLAINKLYNISGAKRFIRKNFTLIDIIVILIGTLFCISLATHIVDFSRSDTKNALIAYDYGNYNESYEKAKLAANKGDPTAQYLLGEMYLFGHGVEKNLPLAFTWLEKSANQGNADAQVDLAELYDHSIPETGIAKDYAKAIMWYQKALAGGNASAATNLGFLYKKGWGVEKNLNKAMELYQIAAAKGDGTAMYNLGFNYMQNANIPNHYILAAEWYQKAIKVNLDPCSRNDLAMLYSTGKGVPADSQKAAALYQDATKSLWLYGQVSPDFKLNDVPKNISREQIGIIFAQYQAAKANHIDNSMQLSQKYSPAAVNFVKAMSQKLEEQCWE